VSRLGPDEVVTSIVGRPDDHVMRSEEFEGFLQNSRWQVRAVAVERDDPLAAAGGDYKIYKNTLVRLAVADGPQAPIHDMLSGPTAIAFSDDPVAAAKVVVAYANRNDKLTIVGGGLAGRQIDVAEVRELASLPSLDVLRGRLIGLLQAPAARLARVLQAPAGQVARVLAAHAENQGGSA